MEERRSMVQAAPSRLAGPLTRNLLLLRYKGRKSGRMYTTPVGYVREGDRLVVVTSPRYSWWRNVVGGAEVSVLSTWARRATWATQTPRVRSELDRRMT